MKLTQRLKIFSAPEPRLIHDHRHDGDRFFRAAFADWMLAQVQRVELFPGSQNGMSLIAGNSGTSSTIGICPGTTTGPGEGRADTASSASTLTQVHGSVL